MKTKFYIFLATLLFYPFLSSHCQTKLKLWYRQPAKNWMTEALPIGNGELGAMFFGGINQEQIQFNEKTLWEGSSTKRGAYQNFGQIFLDFGENGEVDRYSRSLSLDSAIGNVLYVQNGIRYKREYFASKPDQVIVLRIEALNVKGKVSLGVHMKDAHKQHTFITKNTMETFGKLELLDYEAQLCVIPENGKISTKDSGIVVSNADAVTIVLAAGTTFDISKSNYVSGTKATLKKLISDRVVNASQRSYAELKLRHIQDYWSFFGRVSLELGTDFPAIPTDELVKNHNNSTYLDMLYFQYGRYLMLSSSRGMDLPNNLQGIWNNINNPPWESDIHTNINIQMNYWPAESANLSECHQPFLNYIYHESQKDDSSWKKIAQNLGLRGWAVNTQSNIFGHTDWNANRPANAWYCMHLWQHFQFIGDKSFLKNKALPVMKSTCEYWFDRLKANQKGKLVAPDEWSPEHGDWEDGVAYAQQLIWELFHQTLLACELVEADKKFVQELKEKYAKLDRGVHVGDWGQLREWKTQSDIKGDSHRHLSHLIALYPGHQVSYLLNPEHADAAKVSLISRGDQGTGWSRAWKIACWARLFDGDHAYTLLKSALQQSTTTEVSMDSDKGGVYDNLLDSHPPFQIDGNFGATAGIIEMLLQSHLNEIHVLPALPAAWSKGRITGIKAVGNYTVDITWAMGKVTQIAITPAASGTCILRTAQPVHIADVKFDMREDNGFFVYSFVAKKNERYNFFAK